MAEGDSAASRHYIRPQDAGGLLDIAQPETPVEVTLHNLETLTSELEGKLPLDEQLLSAKARTATVLNGLGSASLISLGQLCNDGCTVVLTRTTLRVCKAGKVLIQGPRNWNDRLWDIELLQPRLHQPKYKPTIHKREANSKKQTVMSAIHNQRPNPIVQELPCMAANYTKCETLSVIIRKKQPKADLVKITNLPR